MKARSEWSILVREAAAHPAKHGVSNDLTFITPKGRGCGASAAR